MALFKSKLQVAASVCLLLNSRQEIRCVGKEDDDKYPKDFKYFVKGLSETAGKEGNNLFNNLSGKKGEKGNIGSTGNELFDNASDFIFKTFDSGAPGQIGYGFLMGYCSGYCVKKVSKIAAFVLGGIFIGLQSLAYTGFINVNYDKFQQGVENELDLNHDGKLDIEDAKVAWKKVESVLSYNMPSGGGFTAGLYMGLRG